MDGLGDANEMGRSNPPPFFHPPQYSSAHASTDLRMFTVRLRKHTEVEVAFGEIETLNPLLSWEETVGAKSEGQARVQRAGERGSV